MQTKKRTIFHIDVNSAYLSWEAAYRLQQGESLDLREVLSIVGGDPKTRHGIVLAKSIPAKKYNIKTGETIYSALQKCPHLIIVPPSYDLYIKCSNAMAEIVKKYSSNVQRYSVDECFIDYTHMEEIFGKAEVGAYKIKEQIKEELGFTVNVGISNNKLLAKMASDLKKPDQVLTLFPGEMSKKMWPLPVEDLFMVGRATTSKLHKLGIYTIGELARYDLQHLKYILKSHGQMIWEYANGIEDSKVRDSNYVDMKGLGNSTTIAFDVVDKIMAHRIILSIVEMVAMRLRDAGCCCKLIVISIKNSDFKSYSHQKKLFSATDVTNEIYHMACQLFDEIWAGEPIRHLGVRVSELISNDCYQQSLFDYENKDKLRNLDSAVDSLRLRYGSKTVIRASFLHSGIKPLTGGVGPEDYPMMGSIL